MEGGRQARLALISLFYPRVRVRPPVRPSRISSPRGPSLPVLFQGSTWRTVPACLTPACCPLVSELTGWPGPGVTLPPPPSTPGWGDQTSPCDSPSLMRVARRRAAPGSHHWVRFCPNSHTQSCLSRWACPARLWPPPGEDGAPFPERETNPRLGSLGTALCSPRPPKAGGGGNKSEFPAPFSYRLLSGKLWGQL